MKHDKSIYIISISYRHYHNVPILLALPIIELTYLTNITISALSLHDTP